MADGSVFQQGSFQSNRADAVVLRALLQTAALPLLDGVLQPAGGLRIGFGQTDMGLIRGAKAVAEASVEAPVVLLQQARADLGRWSGDRVLL